MVKLEKFDIEKLKKNWDLAKSGELVRTRSGAVVKIVRINNGDDPENRSITALVEVEPGKEIPMTFFGDGSYSRKFREGKRVESEEDLLLIKQGSGLFPRIKIVKFDRRGNCCFVYFDWKDFRFKTTCWASNIGDLLGENKLKKHFLIGLYQ